MSKVSLIQPPMAKLVPWQIGGRIYLLPVKTVEINVDSDGVLKLPARSSLPAEARLAVIVFEPRDDLSGAVVAGLAQLSGTFDFLSGEPDIYSDADILPGRKNPQFRR